MPGTELLVDGYNILLALAKRDGVRRIDDQLPRLRGILHGLLSEWAVARERPVAVAWDGAGAVPESPPPGLRIVFVEPPAEADDWIVGEATARRRANGDVAVVTADRGLLARLPGGVEVLDVTRFMDDLRALGGATLRSGRALAEAAIGDEIPASDAPVDLARLPRRRASRRRISDDPRPAPGERAARPRPASAAARPADGKPGVARSDSAGGADAEADAREAARRRKDAKREKWERARARRDAAGRGRRRKKGR